MLPASATQPQLLGLNLLRLLVANRIAEFHTELETISPEVCVVLNLVCWLDWCDIETGAGRIETASADLGGLGTCLWL
jgi:hypothetical protein